MKHELMYLAAHKVDWRKVGKFLAYPKEYDQEAFRQELLVWLRSLKFYDERLSPERIKLKTLALFNYIWECNREELSKKEGGWPKDSNTNSNLGFYSILLLLYLETSEWRVDRIFWGVRGEEADALTLKDGEAVDHELLAAAGQHLHFGGEWNYDNDAYEYVFNHLQKKWWAGKYAKEPAPVLGLSFLAQGCDDTLRSFKGNDWSNLQLKYVFNHAFHTTGYLLKYQLPYSDWTARYVMFVLAQRLYVQKNVERPESSVEQFIFASLYLRFYRQGPDGLLGRQSLGQEWKAIPWEKKEEEAAHCRRVIIENRAQSLE